MDSIAESRSERIGKIQHPPDPRTSEIDGLAFICGCLRSLRFLRPKIFFVTQPARRLAWSSRSPLWRVWKIAANRKDSTQKTQRTQTAANEPDRSGAPDDAFDFQPWRAEMQQQARARTGCPGIVQALRPMNRIQHKDGLDLHPHRPGAPMRKPARGARGGAQRHGPDRSIRIRTYWQNPVPPDPRTGEIDGPAFICGCLRFLRFLR